MDEKLRLVLIEWEEPSNRSMNWRPLDGAVFGLAVCRSVGWLIHEERDFKTIVAHIGTVDVGKSHGRGDITIPTSTIHRIVDLNEDPADSEKSIA